MEFGDGKKQQSPAAKSNKIQERLKIAIWLALLFGLITHTKSDSFIDNIGYFRLLVLYILISAIGIPTIADFIMDAHGTTTFSFLWKLTIISGCGYLLITQGFLIAIAFGLLSGFASMIVYSTRSDKKTPATLKSIALPLFFCFLWVGGCAALMWLLFFGIKLLLADSAKPFLISIGCLVLGLGPGIIAFNIFQKRTNITVALALGVISGILGPLFFYWLITYPWGGYPVQTSEYKRIFSIDYFSEQERTMCELLRHKINADPSMHLNSNDNQTVNCVRRWIRSGLWKRSAKTSL